LKTSGICREIRSELEIAAVAFQGHKPVDDFGAIHIAVILDAAIFNLNRKGAHTMLIKRAILFLMMFGIYLLSAFGAEFSKYEVIGEYSFMRTINSEHTATAGSISADAGKISISTGEDDLNGFKAGMAFNVNKYFGIAGEFGWNQKQNASGQTSFSFATTPCVIDMCKGSQTIVQSPMERSRERYTLLAGPRFSINSNKYVRPYAQILLGWSRSTRHMKQNTLIAQNWTSLAGPAVYTDDINLGIAPESQSSFTFAGGGGLDCKINKRFSLRLFELEYLYSSEDSRHYSVSAVQTYSLKNGITASTTNLPVTFSKGQSEEWKSNVRLSFGIVFHIKPGQGSAK
jgi:opacity protein-like surface antigen